jgi:hypothetical protein
MFGTYGTLRDWTAFFDYGTFMRHMGHGSDGDIIETIGTFSIEGAKTHSVRLWCAWLANARWLPTI